MSETAALPEYLALAKNVRGIFAFDPANDPPSDLKTWLARIHQYRNVGITPTTSDHTDLDLSAKTYERLPYPVDGLEPFLKDLTEEHPRWLIESLIFSSAYVTPLFVHQPALQAFKPTAVWKLRTTDPLPVEQVKRHMRIAGYGMLDFHRDFTERAAGAIQNGELQAEQRRRKEVCKEDGQDRFWRLLDEDDSKSQDGEWVGGYCDILSLLDKSAVRQIRENHNLHVALGVAGVFILKQPAE